jgi:hypothetical protein
MPATIELANQATLMDRRLPSLPHEIGLTSIVGQVGVGLDSSSVAPLGDSCLMPASVQYMQLLRPRDSETPEQFQISNPWLQAGGVLQISFSCSFTLYRTFADAVDSFELPPSASFEFSFQIFAPQGLHWYRSNKRYTTFWFHQ